MLYDVYVTFEKIGKNTQFWEKKKFFEKFRENSILRLAYFEKFHGNLISRIADITKFCGNLIWRI